QTQASEPVDDPRVDRQALTLDHSSISWNLDVLADVDDQALTNNHSAFCDGLTGCRDDLSILDRHRVGRIGRIETGDARANQQKRTSGRASKQRVHYCASTRSRTLAERPIHVCHWLAS